MPPKKGGSGGKRPGAGYVKGGEQNQDAPREKRVEYDRKRRGGGDKSDQVNNFSVSSVIMLWNC